MKFTFIILLAISENCIFRIGLGERLGIKISSKLIFPRDFEFFCNVVCFTLAVHISISNVLKITIILRI